MPSSDFVIAGAGVIGLALALELDRRGAAVVILEAGAALQQASSAAAGMLALTDPLNPRALTPLAEFSASLYPAFLSRITTLSGLPVPFQTTSTLQAAPRSASQTLPSPQLHLPELEPGPHHFRLLDERSIDPRQLAPSLLAAVRATRIDLREHTALTRVAMSSASARIDTPAGAVAACFLIDCMGAFSPAPVLPRKGQMLAVQLPRDLALTSVVRTEDVYIVPRTTGPQAGRAIIGATIEDAGFDLTVHPKALLALHARAAALLPALARAEFLESWAGLRPMTRDGLPLLGPDPRQPRYVLANGHFRNGILLAPATAHVIAQLLTGEAPSIDLSPFAPERFL